jgi:1,4-dihydroxy-2-naphthoate octaprenyltransferase
MDLKSMFLETRPQFLILSPILVFLGMGMAFYDGSFCWPYFLLCMIGLVLLHASVNTLNDYSDFKTGIDLTANRTPFSGGSGFLPSGTLSSKTVFRIGMGAFLLAAPIGVFFIAVRGWHLLPLFLVGALFVLLYTSHFTRVGAGIAEISAGLGLGTLPVFGTYIIMANDFSWSALYASVPSGFLVLNLLLLNEFPDADADRTGGRRTIPILLGHRGAAWVYSTLAILTYIWILAGAFLAIMPYWSLLGLLTLPFGIKAIRGSFTFKALPELIPAQGANVAMVLLTQLLMGVGYLVVGVGN